MAEAFDLLISGGTFLGAWWLAGSSLALSGLGAALGLVLALVWFAPAHWLTSALQQAS